MKELILASKSPRRKELLSMAGVAYTVETAEVEEKYPDDLTPPEIVQYLAGIKAEAVFSKHPDRVVLGADTIVVLDGQILGKPKDKEDAVRMLTLLSGRTHEVYTGVAILSGEREKHFYERTEVTFYKLGEEEIRAYVETGEPLDKAGSYGIQGRGLVFIRCLNGDYATVVGLPVGRVVRELEGII